MGELIDFEELRMIKACYNASKILDAHGDGDVKVIHVMDWKEDQKNKVEKTFEDMIQKLGCEMEAAMRADGYDPRPHGWSPIGKMGYTKAEQREWRINNGIEPKGE